MYHMTVRGAETASDLLWVLPLLTCGYSPKRAAFREVGGVLRTPHDDDERTRRVLRTETPDISEVR